MGLRDKSSVNFYTSTPELRNSMGRIRVVVNRVPSEVKLLHNIFEARFIKGIYYFQISMEACTSTNIV